MDSRHSSTRHLGAHQSMFQLLRPECIQISQLLARKNPQSIDWTQLENALATIRDHLEAADHLDEALTDYVLFPLIQVLRLDSVVRPSSVTTAALGVLSAILRAGRIKLSQPEFSIQILLLLTNLFEKQGKLLSQRLASEPEVEAMCSCLQRYFTGGNVKYPPSVTSGPDPQLVIFGTLLAILFEVIASEDVSIARLSALQAIQAMYLSEAGGSALLRRYLPGLLSNLVKPFVNLSSARWSFRALQLSLNIIESAFIKCLDLRPGSDSTSSPGESKSRGEWLSMNKANLSSALKQLIKVQDHERAEVRDALFDMCITLLEITCQRLEDGQVQLLVQTIIALKARRVSTSRDARIHRLLEGSGRLREISLVVCNASIDRLPSLIQSPDQSRRLAAFSAATGSLDFVIRHGNTTQTLNSLTESILASVALLMQQGRPHVQAFATDLDRITELKDPHLNVNADSIFGPGVQVQSDIPILETLIQSAITGPLGPNLLGGFSNLVETGSTSTRSSLARMWILTRCIEELGRSPRLKVKDPNLTAQLENALDVAYSASLDVLRRAPTEAEADWRAQALALNLVSLRADFDLEAFRPELAYALYPILERIACNDSAIQKHAVQALRIVSKACGYRDPRDLIFSNSDYLINAVSIRLNTFDVRPESATVLQLAIRLCGPAFLPYIGDISESIFAILDMYHGYPGLVQSMFAVLGSILDQAPGHAFVKGEGPDRRGVLSETEVIEKVGEIERSSFVNDSVDSRIRSHEEANDKSTTEVTTTKSDDDTSTHLLIARVMRQGQFYLTYEDSGVRHELLKILKRGLWALRRDEDTLLPVINDLWPVTVIRLYDSEPFVVIEALDFLGTAISCAGDFLSSRFEDEWPKLKHLFLRYRPTHSQSNSRSQTPMQGSQSQAERVWTAIVEFMSGFLKSIRVGPDLEDDVIEIFGGEAMVNMALETSLDGLNADGLWLWGHLHGNIDSPTYPNCGGMTLLAPLPR